MNRIIALSTISVLILVTAFTFVPAVFADSSTHMNVSFQTSAGNSAGWVVGPGQGSSSEAYLAIGSSSALDGFAVIVVHHFSSNLPDSDPSFSATNFAEGTPRIYIQMSDSDFIFIYPTGSQDAADAYTNFGQTFNYDYQFSNFLSLETGLGAHVTAVLIIADTSQGYPNFTPYTSLITSFQYNGACLIGSCPSQ